MSSAGQVATSRDAGKSRYFVQLVAATAALAGLLFRSRDQRSASRADRTRPARRTPITKIGSELARIERPRGEVPNRRKVMSDSVPPTRSEVQTTPIARTPDRNSPLPPNDGWGTVTTVVSRKDWARTAEATLPIAMRVCGVNMLITRSRNRRPWAISFGAGRRFELKSFGLCG